MLTQASPLVDAQVSLWRKYIQANINEALELTPEDKLGWAPAAGMLTLGQVFAHIAETSDWWYDEVVRKNISVELASKTVASKAELKKHLQIHWARLERFFAEPPEALGKTYSFVDKGKTWSFTGYWIFTHLLEHDIHHRCQIHQYLRILGIKPPRM